MYSELDPETSHIRLVRFKASTPPDPGKLELEFRNASFDDADNHYAALSYVWGAPDKSTEAQIVIGGHPFSIGHNLYLALTQLHENGVRSWLWVDSICINQWDLVEKSWQVGQMRDVYSRADLVYIWLGHGSPETDKAMDFVSRVGPRASAVGVLDLRSNQELGEVTQYIQEISSSPRDRYDENDDRNAIKTLARFYFDLLHEPDLQENHLEEDDVQQNELGVVTSAGIVLNDDRTVKGITELMHREYWHRIWIFQEISLANEAVILCGEKAVSLDIFDATFSAVSICISPSFHSISRLTRNFGRSIFGGFYSSIALTLRRKYCRRDTSEKIRLANVIFQTGSTGGRPHYSATDARDILFGLLGIIDDEGVLGMQVDYSMTLVEVFTVLTRAMTSPEHETRGDYNLDQCVPDSRYAECASLVDYLPSWVPDWRKVGKWGISTYPINYNGYFNATARMPTPQRSNSCPGDPCRGLFLASGCRVDSITEIMDWRASGILDDKGWLASIRDFAKLGPESGPGEDYVWRTITQARDDMSYGPHAYGANPVDDEKAFIIRKVMRQEPIALDALTETQREYIQNAMFKQDYKKTLEEWIEYIVKQWPKLYRWLCKVRTLFSTAKGRFSLGHVAIRPGDIVTLLWGVRSPIILRPRNNQDGGGFTFVGDAYVDGIMYGEFLETGPRWKTLIFIDIGSCILLAFYRPQLFFL
jgi:hypothetical protein